MTIRWDKLFGTKNTLLKHRDPVTADAYFEYSVIWVNVDSNEAWLLRDGVVRVLPSTISVATLVGGSEVSQEDFNDLEATVNNLADQIDDVVKSQPASGDYKISKLALDGNGKIIVTHNDNPES